MRAVIVMAVLSGSLFGWPGAEPASQAASSVEDTLHLKIGSKEVDGRVYKPHAARVRVRIGDMSAPIVSEWTNELTVGDSAGRQVHRWVTKGKTSNGGGVEWELRQTYDAITLAPMGYHSTNSKGGYSSLRIDGTSVKGEKRTANDTTLQMVDVTIDQLGYFAGATDLVPAAVGFKAGKIISAPVWSPGMEKAETRVFAIRGVEKVDVEGKSFEAWKVEEYKTDGSQVATWYLLDHSPYMVYGLVPLPNGKTQVITEVEIPRS